MEFFIAIKDPSTLPVNVVVPLLSIACSATADMLESAVVNALPLGVVMFSQSVQCKYPHRVGEHYNTEWQLTTADSNTSAVAEHAMERNHILRENPSEEVDDDIMIVNKSQIMTVFWREPEIDFRYETKARKVMVDFKFDALYR